MNVTNNEGQITITLKEDFTSDLMNDFRSSVQKEINNGNTSFIIDFKDTVVIDSMGIGCLVATYNSLKQKCGTIQLSNLSENLKDVFQVMRLDHILPFI